MQDTLITCSFTLDGSKKFFSRLKSNWTLDKEILKSRIFLYLFWCNITICSTKWNLLVFLLITYTHDTAYTCSRVTFHHPSRTPLFVWEHVGSRCPNSRFPIQPSLARSAGKGLVDCEDGCHKATFLPEIFFLLKINAYSRCLYLKHRKPIKMKKLKYV